MRVLGIETSCDETAAAVVEDGHRILSNVIHSQIDTHKLYGGIVPELASREHIRKIRPIVESALNEARIGVDELDGIAATYGPGLVGSLLVGLTYAKAMAYAARIPLIGIDHIEGHIYSVFIENPGVRFPALALVVSGGHTSLFWVESRTGDCAHLDYRLIGKTRDDAAGEAYDKVDQAMDFSFSGIKTAVLRTVKEEGLQRLDEAASREHQDRLDLLAGFQEGVVGALVARTMDAALRFEPNSILLSGGVAANSRLREAMMDAAAERELDFYCPDRGLTTDNAAMIASVGTFKLMRGERSDYSLDADPTLKLAAAAEPSKKGRWKV